MGRRCPAIQWETSFQATMTRFWSRRLACFSSLDFDLMSLALWAETSRISSVTYGFIGLIFLTDTASVAPCMIFVNSCLCSCWSRVQWGTSCHSVSRTAWFSSSPTLLCIHLLSSRGTVAKAFCEMSEPLISTATGL